MVIEWGFITQKCEFLELFIKRIVDVMAFHQENVVMKQEMPGDIGFYLLCRKSELRSWRLVSYPAIWWPLFSNRKRTCVWSMLTNLVRVINSTIGFSSIYIYIYYIYILYIYIIYIYIFGQIVNQETELCTLYPAPFLGANPPVNIPKP